MQRAWGTTVSNTAARDLTDEMIRLSRRAAEAEARFRGLAEGSLQGVAIHRGGRLLFMNQAYAGLLGYPDAATACAEATIERHVLPEDLDATREQWRRVLAGDRTPERQRHRRRRVDGGIAWVDLVMQPTLWEGEPAIQVTAIDVTREVEAQAELQRGGDRFRELAAGSLQGIVIHDGRRCLFANEAFAHMLGFVDARAAMAQTDIAELVFPADRPAVVAEWRQMMDGARTWSRQREQRQRIDGTLAWFDSVRGPVTWFGRPAIQTIAIDVTREVEAEIELRRSEARFRAVVENLPAMLTLKDADRRFRIVNPAFERWHGITAQDAIGRTSEELAERLPNAPRQSWIAREDELTVIETGEPIVRERGRKNLRGEQRDVIVTKFAVRGVSGNVEGVGTVVSDISELKRAQALQARHQQELQRNQGAILEVLRDGLGAGSVEQRIRRILAVAGETLGVDIVALWRHDPDADAIRCIERWRASGMPDDDGLYPQLVPMAEVSEFYRALEQHVVVPLDLERQPTGLAAFVDRHYAGLSLKAALGVLVRLPDGPVGHIALGRCGSGPWSWSVEDESFARSIAELIHICVLQGTLERRSQALRRNHEALVRLMREGLMAGGPPRAVLDTIVRIACTTLGIRRVSLWSHLGAGEFSECIASWDDQLQRHLRLPEEEPPVPTGTVRGWFAQEYLHRLMQDLVVAVDDVETSPMMSPSGRAHCRDRAIGARMAAQVRLPDRDAGVVAFVAGPGPRRWSAEDRAFARSIADLVAFVLLSQHHRQALAALDLVSQGLYVEDRRGAVIYANRLARRLAGAIDPAPPGRALSLDAFPALAAGGADGNATGEMAWRAPAGDMLELAVTRTVLPEEGAITLIADITADKQRERERLMLEAEMRQAARLEAVGRLASGIAHDFNNLLGAILGFAAFLQEDLPRDSAQHGYAARITRASEHAKEVVKQLLAFTRATDVERRVTDLAALVRESGELLRASLPSSTRLVIASGGDVLPAAVNSAQIHQILLNLCLNAHDALDGQPGTVTVSLARSEGGRELVASEPRGDTAITASGHLRGDRSYARLTVADDGAGMDAATLGRAFDPFFTTKGPGRGTGLGLAVVYGIVNAYDGAVAVESRPGGGTTFSIYLPLASDAPAEVGETRPADRVRGSERILVVDDEADLLEMMRIGLTRLGYAVTACPDPIDALELFRREPQAWGAVVTDQVMPRMKGFTLIGKLREIRPDCPIILCTGFNDGATERQARNAGAGGFFLKPVEPYRIAETIRALRDG